MDHFPYWVHPASVISTVSGLCARDFCQTFHTAAAWFWERCAHRTEGRLREADLPKSLQAAAAATGRGDSTSFRELLRLPPCSTGKRGLWTGPLLSKDMTLILLRPLREASGPHCVPPASDRRGVEKLLTVVGGHFQMAPWGLQCVSGSGVWKGTGVSGGPRPMGAAQTRARSDLGVQVLPLAE